MSGIYIHIPFCASRCIYCDFYSTTLKGKAHEYVDAVLKEYKERSDFLPVREPLRTVYIGGGTPSQLPAFELRRLLDSITANKQDLEEITVEANPEDVTQDWIESLIYQPSTIGYKHLTVNRISMGIQSLDDQELKTLNRRHNSNQPAQAVSILRNAGIKNISLDLMYGLPGQTMHSWEKSIDGIIALNPEHISAYCLSIEEGTLMEKLVSEGKLVPANDELCNSMAQLLRSKLHKAGYIQYEISNYAKPGYESKHNSSYWDNTAYLGLGPGAHSYDGRNTRCWNSPDLNSYLVGDRKHDYETLSAKDIFNERIMLGLRTRNGVSLSIINTCSDKEKLRFAQLIQTLTARNLVHTINNNLVLTQHGLNLADEVIRDLMID